MAAKKEYVYCIWAHDTVQGESPYIYRMVATSQKDVREKWKQSTYWYLVIDHIERSDITPEYLNRPYNFDDDTDDRLIGQYITVDPKVDKPKTSLSDFDKMRIEAYEAYAYKVENNLNATAMEINEALRGLDIADHIRKIYNIKEN